MSTELSSKLRALRIARERAGNSWAGRGRGWGCARWRTCSASPHRAADDEPPAGDPLAPRAPHFAPKATSVIWLFMEGAPSAVDLFDPKPELDKNHGKKMAIDVFNGNPGPLMKSPFAFRQYGESGAWVCEKYQNVARHVDDIAFIKSCFTESNDHVPALYQMNTGVSRVGLPTAGAWVTYGLGSENRNLPGFVVLGNTQGIKGGPLNWSAGFLPTTYPGDAVPLAGQPDPQSQAARRHGRRRPAGAARPPGQAQRRAPEPSRGRARPHRADRDVRAGLPHADGGDGPGRFLAGTGRNPQALRPRGTRVAVVRPEVPAGPPAGRAGRAVRPGLQRRRVGRPQRSGRQPHRPLRGDRRADPRPADRPQAPGPLRLDAGDLGRRIRPHAGLAGEQRPRPQPAAASSSGWPAPASRGA